MSGGQPKRICSAASIACPACGALVTLHRSATPRIDACGFESYSFRCEECGATLAGMFDPQDDELLVSLLETLHIAEKH